MLLRVREVGADMRRGEDWFFVILSSKGVNKEESESFQQDLSSFIHRTFAWFLIIVYKHDIDETSIDRPTVRKLFSVLILYFVI